MERYQRQILLKELGISGQEKLLSAKVLVVGAGGLGCPILLYLTAAGIGTLGIVDNDIVSLSNLHRQVLYKMEDIGKPKTLAAKLHLENLNPDIKINTYQTYLTTENALDLIQKYDIVVDASDNFPTRYMINDACVLLGKPLVYGAISSFEGQVAVFNVHIANGNFSCNYRDLFPTPPLENEVNNCSEIGVLGVLPGTIGCLQANEVIKMVTDMGNPLINQVQSINLLTNDCHIFNITSSDNASLQIPKNKASFLQKDYSLQCIDNFKNQIDIEVFNSNLNNENATIIDVREIAELPIITEFKCHNIPISTIHIDTLEIPQETIILFCQSGKRSKKAASILSQKYPNKTIYSLKNGILDWMLKSKIE